MCMYLHRAPCSDYADVLVVLGVNAEVGSEIDTIKTSIIILCADI